MSDIINSVQGVGSTLSSWDSCMSKTWCKWPVIAAIIIAALIVLSILWCVFSCLCCGISLCTACTKCLTCGGCCGACRRSGRRRKDPEYQPMPPTPTPYNGGYQPQPAPMMYSQPAPQFATFDTGSKPTRNINEDSLPAMPSWSTATTRRIEDDTVQPRQVGTTMEMNRIHPSPQAPLPIQHQQSLPPLRTQQDYPTRAAALSPVHEQEPLYPQNQNYAPHDRHNEHDVGAGYVDSHYNQVASPRSPAPSYYSTVPPVGAGGTMNYQQQNTRDYFPPQQGPYGNHSGDRTMTSSVAPYPASRESTHFAAQRTTSPPAAMNYNPYESQPEQSQSVRPPSLLQVGRKPVAGSYREV